MVTLTLTSLCDVDLACLGLLYLHIEYTMPSGKSIVLYSSLAIWAKIQYFHSNHVLSILHDP